MNGTETLNAVSNFGLSGMIFYMWYMNSQKESGLKSVIEQQVRVIEALREERAEFVNIIKESASMIARCTEAIEDRAKG